jgi:hypothetical protein
MVRLTALLGVLMSSLLTACASPGLPALTLHRATAYADGEPVTSLDLGGSGEVFIRPRLLATDFEPFPISAEDLRLQVVLRVVLKDGGVLSWTLGSDGDAPRSEGGRRWRPESRGDLEGLELGGARLGPIAVEKIEAVEVLSAWLRAPALESARAQGVSALGPAPQLGADARLWAATGREVERLGAAPLLVARVPVSQERTREQGEHSIRLVIVAPGSLTSGREALRFAASPNEEGVPWPTGSFGGDLCLVVLDLNLQVHPARP